MTWNSYSSYYSCYGSSYSGHSGSYSYSCKSSSYDYGCDKDYTKSYDCSSSSCDYSYDKDWCDTGYYDKDGNWCDTAPEPQPEVVCMEAEDFTLTNFFTQASCTASGDEIVKLHANDGSLSTEFAGVSSYYQLSLFAQDECDGNSKLEIYIDGELVNTIWLDQNNNGGGSNDGDFSEIDLGGYHLAEGSEIEIRACRDGNEYVRLDKLVATPAEEPQPEVVCMEAEDFTLTNFFAVSSCTASGDEIVKLCANDGSLSTEFSGVSSYYQLSLLAQDECDGNSKLEIYIDGELVNTIWLDQNNNGGGDDNGEFSEFDLGSYNIDNGSEIKIYACRDNGEYVRLDKLIATPATEPCDPVDPADASLWGRYFIDGNQDNTEYGASGWEDGVEGAIVTLIKVEDGVETVIGTTTTDSWGNYNFYGLEAGDYFVTFQQPNDVAGVEGYSFVAANIGTDGEDSDVVDFATGATEIFSIAESEHKTNVDAGIVDGGCASLGGRYFVDTNNDDTEYTADGGWEAGVAGATVWLIKIENGVETVIGTTTTDASGTYSFYGLAAGNYYVSFQDPADVAGFEDYGFVTANIGADGEDSDAVDGGKTEVFLLSSNEHKWNIDAGIEAPVTGSIGDTVFFDANEDGVFNTADGDYALEGVEVALLDADGNQVGATQTTGADGQYLFDGLDAGEYQVQFTAPSSDYAFTTEGADDDAATDNDSDADATGLTDVITLGAGENLTTIDAGLVDAGTASIGDTVFFDANEDGVFNTADGDYALEGVEVALLDVDGNQVGATQTTGADGSYLFTGLEAGEYQVQFTAPSSDYAFTTEGADDDAATDNDSDADATGLTDVITLGVGENLTTIDAGLVDAGTAEIGNFVFFDANGDGVFDAADGDTAQEGVEVALLDADGNQVGATQTTGADGSYLFTGLKAGSYQVQFTTAAALGLVFTSASSAAADAANNDSDADETTGLTDLIELSIGESELFIDAGFVAANTAPTAQDTTGMICANQDLTLDLSTLIADADGDALTITEINGTALVDGATVTLSNGVEATLDGTTLTLNGQDAFEGLTIGESSVESLVYTVSDGVETAEGTATITFCGVAETLDEIGASFGSGVEVTYQVQSGYIVPLDTDAYDIALTADDVRLDGLVVTDAFCLDATQAVDDANDFADAASLTGLVYLAQDGYVPADLLGDDLIGINGLTADENLDLINWILNQDFNSQGYTDSEIQSAVWSLTNSQFTIDPDFGDQAAVFEIINATLSSTEAEGYTPGQGDIVGLIVDPEPDTAANSQPFIIGVAFEDLDCIC